MEYWSELVERYGLIPLLLGLAVAPLVAIVVSRLLTGKGQPLAALSSVRRTKCLLCGPVGSGKTTVWQRLVHGSASVKTTHTSMIANVGRAEAEHGGFEIVDFPGHLRLKDDIHAHLPAAKVIAVLVDAVAALDEGVGVHAVALLLSRLIENKAASGATILVAANKRDDVSSFSAKAIRTKVEAELTTIFSSRGRAVGTAKVVGTAGAAAPASRAAKRSETGVFLDEGEAFTFERSCSVPVEFVDIAAVDDDKYNLTPLVEAMRR